MKVVIPYSQERISPVFDVAEHFYLIEEKNGRELSRQKFSFDGKDIFAKAQMLSGLNTDVVICGAISEIQENALRNAKIKLFTFICGDLEEVLATFIQNNLLIEAFEMPGCGGKRRFCHGYRGRKFNYW